MNEMPSGVPDDAEAVDLFQRLVDGDLERDAPEVRQRCAADPAFAAALAGMLALATELQAVRTAPRASEVGAPEPWPGADAAVDRAVAGHFASVRPGPARRRWWPAILLAASLVGLVALVVMRRGVTPDGPPIADPSQRLGERPWPDGPVPRAEFAARGFEGPGRGSEATGATFGITVWIGDREVQSPPLREPRWLPPADLQATLPDAFTWRFRAVAPGRAPREWTCEVVFR
ncbi:MAG: hypothetical protein KF830_00205 [Planctomycetes bacterium]|nr:hypothetical protein [Planctomycetota bacterium]